MKPNISFIIPSFGRVPMLEDTIASVLSQRQRDNEIIVVDDGSSVPIREEIGHKYPNVHFILLKKNSGPSNARNVGLENAHGKYICFLDSDDILDKNFSSYMVETLTISNSAVLSLSYPIVSGELSILEAVASMIINLFRNFILVWLYYFNGHQLKKEAFFGTSLSRMIFPKYTVEYMKFNENLRNCEDWEFILRFMKIHPVYILPKRLVGFRFTQNSLTKTWRKKTNWQHYDHVINMLPDESKRSLLILGFRLYKNIFSRVS